MLQANSIYAERYVLKQYCLVVVLSLGYDLQNT